MPDEAEYQRDADVATDAPCTVPACIATAESVDRNAARQVVVRRQPVAAVRKSGKFHFRTEDGRTVRVAARRPQLDQDELALVCATGPDGPSPKALAAGQWAGAITVCEPAAVINSWADSFAFRAADASTGRAGLRAAQIGALHAVLGYWTTRPTEPATVVMPTGTGKTETVIWPGS
jgi:hypothetical protein